MLTNKLLSILNDKVILMNISTLTLSFADIEEILKLVLLIFSIIYTIVKIFRGGGNETIDKVIQQIFNKKDKMDDN